MKLLRLNKLYIRQLEYLFSPPGLPLVAKADPKGACTTTVLIRGEAGAGKTTLALAIAHSIARSRKGAVLVLNTETAPVEVDAKAAFLEISRGSVVAWSGRSKVKRGTILVQHIALAAAPGEIDAEQTTRPGMLDVIWEMLQTYGDEDPARVPIVAVMIDGMLLAERDETSGPTRSDTAAFLQALETRGISTVIVEESAPKQVSWLPFVVDLVFELQFNVSEDAGKLVRQLVCRKSRYTPAFAGPHEYDLDEDSVPSVWPDPLDIDPEILRGISGVGEPAVFWPMDAENVCWVWRGAGVITAEVGPDWDIVMAMLEDRFPSPLFIDLEDGAEGLSEDGVQPYSRGGIYALFWRILHKVRTEGRGAVGLHDLDRLLAHSQTPTLFFRALRALVRSGVLIGVRGDAEEIKKLQPFSTFSPNFRKAAGQKKLARREGRSIDRWLIQNSAVYRLTSEERSVLASEERSVLANAIFVHDSGTLGQVLASSEAELVDIKALVAAIETVARNSRKANPPGLTAGLSLVTLACIQQIVREGGSEAEYTALLENLDVRDARVSTQRALLWYLHGDDWRAARSFIVSNGLHKPLDRVIWSTLCARYAGSDAATRCLHAIATSDQFALDVRRLAASSFARLQVRRGEYDEARASIEAVADGLEPWLRERWLAEVALEASDEAIVLGAEATLQALAVDPAVPRVHQGEIFFNLALLAERRNDPGAARMACQRALERNSALEGTVQPLRARLGAVEGTDGA